MNQKPQHQKTHNDRFDIHIKVLNRNLRLVKVDNAWDSYEIHYKTAADDHALILNQRNRTESYLACHLLKSFTVGADFKRSSFEWKFSDELEWTKIDKLDLWSQTRFKNAKMILLSLCKMKNAQQVQT